MKIALLTQTFPLHPGDHTAHFMYDFVQGLQNNGHQVTVVLPYSPRLQGRAFTDMTLRPFRYIWPDSWHVLGFGQTLPAKQALRWSAYLLAPFYIVASTLTLYREVKKMQAQAISIHWVLPNGVAGTVVAALTGIPFVVSLPGSDVYLTRVNLLWRSVARWILRQAKTVVADSPQLLADVAMPGHVIPYGVPINPRPRINHQPALVATAGRFIKKTGVPLVKQLDPTIEVLVGLSIAAFRAKLTEVDIFVKLSQPDDQGNLEDSSVAVLEAMAAGCAVVVSDLAGYRTILRHGVNALLVNPHDRTDVQRAIDRLRASPSLRQELGAAARATIAEQYTADRVGQRYAALFTG